MILKCKICAGETKRIFNKVVLGKYPVNYYQCSICKFLQVEDPYWLNEAYATGAISALDTGILSRNLNLRNKTQHILHKLFTDFGDFKALDYGGGEGIFVRMMRDMGYNFYRHDVYADNLYARFFDVKNTPKETRFDILTAFEVFEHLSNPLGEIKKMLEYSDIIFFSTELQPSAKLEELEEWWYIAPETGQHVSFYNEASLEKIADKFGLNFYTDRVNLHIMSSTELKDPFKKTEESLKKTNLAKRIITKLYFKYNTVENSSKAKIPPSLTMKDFELIKEKLNKKG